MRTSHDGGRDVIIEEWHRKQESDYEMRKLKERQRRLKGGAGIINPVPLPLSTFSLRPLDILSISGQVLPHVNLAYFTNYI